MPKDTIERRNYMHRDTRKPGDVKVRDRSYERNDTRGGRDGGRKNGDWDHRSQYKRHGDHDRSDRSLSRRSDRSSSRRTEERRRYSPSSKRRKTGSITSRDSPCKGKDDMKVDDIPDDEVDVPDSLMDSVEKLRMRTKIERNVADEDVEKLTVFSFIGKGYQCKTCGLLLTKESAFSSHLMGKSHVMNVIEARTAKRYKETREIIEADLSPDDWFEKSDVHSIIMKQSKLLMKHDRKMKMKEEANYNKVPSNFYNFDMKLRKSVMKKQEKVVITSLVESIMEVSDFTGGKHFGCEFVRAVTGFHCRLCSVNIRDASGVIPHASCREHRDNYAAYVTKNSDYEKTQHKHNEDLFNIMSQHEGKNVVLAESLNIKSSHHFLSLLDNELVRLPSVMNSDAKQEKGKNKNKKNQGKETGLADKKNDSENMDAKVTEETKNTVPEEKQPAAEVVVIDEDDDEEVKINDVHQEDGDQAEEATGKEPKENCNKQVGEDAGKELKEDCNKQVEENTGKEPKDGKRPNQTKPKDNEKGAESKNGSNKENGNTVIPSAEITSSEITSTEPTDKETADTPKKLSAVGETDSPKENSLETAVESPDTGVESPKKAAVKKVDAVPKQNTESSTDSNTVCPTTPENSNAETTDAFDVVDEVDNDPAA